MRCFTVHVDYIAMILRPKLHAISLSFEPAVPRAAEFPELIWLLSGQHRTDGPSLVDRISTAYNRIFLASQQAVLK